jgi:UMP-CMP kinase
MTLFYRKGTQCQLLQERLNTAGEASAETTKTTTKHSTIAEPLLTTTTTSQWAHLSAGDLLRAERQKNGPMATTINDAISAGRIVPAEITVQLLQIAMQEASFTRGCTKFLIDGFPRSEGNVQLWEQTMKQHKVEFVLNLECPEEVLVGRLLERGQTSGRSDDQIDVIRKRFHTFQEECKPIVEMYSKQNMVRTIPADQPVEEVYEQIAALFHGL